MELPLLWRDLHNKASCKAKQTIQGGRYVLLDRGFLRAKAQLPYASHSWFVAIFSQCSHGGECATNPAFSEQASQSAGALQLMSHYLSHCLRPAFGMALCTNKCNL